MLAADDLLQRAAEHLDRAAEELVELDRRSLVLLLTAGTFVTLTVRDRQRRDVHEVTLEQATGRVVDAAVLRTQDREALEQRTALDPLLRGFLLRHPETPSLEVLVTRADGTLNRVTTDPAGVVALADDPAVVQVRRAGDAVVRDAASGVRTPQRHSADDNG